MKKLLAIITCLGGLALAGSAQAIVLTFDDLPDIIPSGPEPTASVGTYGGLTWSNFRYLDPSEINVWHGITNSGYSNGLVSPNHVAYNAAGAAASVTNGTFDFNGAYLTGAWNDGLNIEVRGWLGGVLQYNTTVVVNSTGPTWFAFNYLNVDTVAFNSFGGVNAGYGAFGQQFAMDNFTYNANAVPEPATILIIGTGLIGMASLRKYFAK